MTPLDARHPGVRSPGAPASGGAPPRAPSPGSTPPSSTARTAVLFGLATVVGVWVGLAAPSTSPVSRAAPRGDRVAASLAVVAAEPAPAPVVRSTTTTAAPARPATRAPAVPAAAAPPTTAPATPTTAAPATTAAGRRTGRGRATGDGSRQ